MRNFKKVLSALLAIVLVFSTMTIGAEAAYNAYKDSGITGYDCIDKPILTTDQYASMAMDEVDRMLAEANLKITYDLAGLMTINADLTSIDNALNSINDLWNTVSSMQDTIGGDVKNLDFSALTSAPRRGDAGSTDGDIFKAVFQFLADNAGVVAKLPKGTVENGGLDLGIIAGFVDISDFLDIPLLAKEAVAELVYPDYKTNPPTPGFTPKSKTLDEYVSTFIDLIVTGNYDAEKSDTINKISSRIQQYVPDLNTQVDFVNDSVYDIVENLFRLSLNSVIVPLANSTIKKIVREKCGVVYTPVLDDKGEPVLDQYKRPTYTQDASKLNEFADILNINFSLTAFDISGWGAVGSDSFINHINDILGKVIEEVANPDNVTINWDYTNGNSGILNNIINVAKQVLDLTDNKFFASYVEVITDAQLAAMSNDQFLAYLARSIINGSIGDVFVDNSCDTLLKVAFATVKSIAANVVPSRDYSSLTPSLDSILAILCDMGSYGLNQITNMDLAYGLTPDELADEAFSWVETNYGGFVSDIQGTDGWTKASYVIFSLIPSNWLPTDEYGGERNNLYTIIVDDIVQNIIDLDFDGIFALFARNNDGELNGTIIEVLLARITGIFNYIIPGTFSDSYSYTTLEGLLDANLLSDLIYNLLTGLNDRVDTVMPSMLPLLCSVLGLSSAEKFDYPYISLPETLDTTSTTSFYMYNGSSGINTAATDKNGDTTQDSLYTYEITNIETNNPDVTVSPTTATINGGESQVFTLGGAANAESSVLTITITYDVYGETGNCMTATPLTATCMTYVSQTKDDGSEVTKKDTSTGNAHLVNLKVTKYLNQNSKLTDLNDVEFTLQRNVAKQSTQHTLNSTFSLTSATIDASLANAGVVSVPMADIATTPKGGAWPYTPYSVPTTATELLEEGMYTSNFTFNATKTMSAAETISFSHFVYIYNDFGLPGLYSNATRSNRQMANYSQGSYEVTYTGFDSYLANNADRDATNDVLNDVTETVSGAEAWANYITALEEATAIMCRPRTVGTFEEMAAGYEDAARNLYTYMMQLEGGSLSSGAAGVKTALESFVPACATKIDPETSKEVNVDYYENGYTFFGREDYVGYTYANFKSEKKAAENLINAEKKGEDIDSIKAAYVQHRVTLYGNRLIRVKAYKEHLNAELALANAVTANHYSEESWTKFVNARTFATAVAAEAIGSCVVGTDYLSGSGLRQSKVNTARSELIEARKKLISSVDYTQLNTAIANTVSVYTAGNAAGTYTALSWAAFAEDYTDAIGLVAQALTWSQANQDIVNAAATALTQTFAALESTALPGIEIVENAINGISSLVLNETETPSTIDGNNANFVSGIYQWAPSVDGAYNTTGGAYSEVDYTFNESAMQSTGARIMVYTDSTKETLLKSYWVVFFGDLNGDAQLDAVDSSLMLDAFDYTPDWSWAGSIDDNAFYRAADLNHDLSVDATDGSIFNDVLDGLYMPNQNWDGVTDTEYMGSFD